MKRLTDQLTSYEQGTTRQIAVIIVPSLDGDDIDDFAIRVAEKWKIGSRKNNDGVLVTLAIQDRKDRIDVGYGLEGELTDAMTSRIRRELMEPRFKEGDYEGGLRAGLAAIDTATGGHEHAEGKLPARTRDDGGGVPIGLIVAIIFIVVIAIARRGGRGGRGGGGGSSWFWPGFFIGMGRGGGGWSGGSSGWSGGGGFGGGGGWSGGGGSFGGGGSSGSW